VGVNVGPWTLRDEAALAAVASPWLDAHRTGGVFGLSGTLGAGKTAFVRAIVHELFRRAGEPPPRVPSPTYVFRTTYEAGAVPVEHFDLYRLDTASAATLAEIGYYEAVERVRGERGYLFVEWPERADDPHDLDLTERWELRRIDETETRLLLRSD
jgi:tRNA threonylcarbamoyladenosine biosynthesis protein TsaE